MADDALVSSRPPDWYASALSAGPARPPSLAPAVPDAAPAAIAPALSSDFYDRLAQRESSGRYGATTSTGKGYSVYGKYQLDPEEIRRWAPPGTQPDAFLHNPELQEATFRRYAAGRLKEIEDAGLMKYVGQTVNGVPVTVDGLFAGAHLGGTHGLKRYLEGRGNPSDALGTSIGDYVAQFSQPAGATPPRSQRSQRVFNRPPADDGTVVAALRSEMGSTPQNGSPTPREYPAIEPETGPEQKPQQQQVQTQAKPQAPAAAPMPGILGAYQLFSQAMASSDPQVRQRGLMDFLTAMFADPIYKPKPKEPENGDA